MDAQNFRTAITHTAPGEIRVRGYPIEQLMGEIGFGQAIHLVLRGELPGPRIGKLIEAILVSSIDHGPVVPSALAARNAASTGAPLAGCVAAGILAMNRFHGGAIEDCARTIRDVLSRAAEKNIGFADAAAQIVSESRQRGERIAGFGHVLHPLDPRTSRLFELAGEAGCRGKHVQVCEQIESALEKQSGRKLPINVDGAIAAVLLELQFEPDLMNGFFMMARLPGLLAHAREETTREKPLRAVVSRVPSYDGPPHRDVPGYTTGGE